MRRWDWGWFRGSKYLLKGNHAIGLDAGAADVRVEGPSCLVHAQTGQAPLNFTKVLAKVLSFLAT